MEIIGIQIATITFSIAMIYLTYVCYRRKYFEIFSLLIWLLIFTALIVASLFPSFLMPLVKLLKVSRLFDLFLIAGIFFLIGITYINFIYTHKLKSKIDKLVQEKAIEESEKESLEIEENL